MHVIIRQDTLRIPLTGQHHAYIYPVKQKYQSLLRHNIVWFLEAHGSFYGSSHLQPDKHIISLYGSIVTQPAAFKMDYSPGSPEFWRDAVIAVKKRGTNYEMCNMRNFY